LVEAEEHLIADDDACPKARDVQHVVIAEPHRLNLISLDHCVPLGTIA
jgi:hypothetical protein